MTSPDTNMTKEADGGPAFPYQPRGQDGPTDDSQPGMSLRDWFAGQALMGLLAGQWNVRADSTTPQTLPASVHALAGNAYAMADAMLAERSKP